MKDSISLEQYGEFKGTTKEALNTLITEIKGLREDVDELKSFKAYTIGIAAVVGFVASFLRDVFIKKI